MTVLLQHIYLHLWEHLLQFGIRSATASYIYIYGNSYCNGTLAANNVPPPNSTFTSSILNLVDDSACAAHSYIYGNIYCNGTLTANNALTLNCTFIQSILNLVYNSASAAYIYVYRNTYCNGTLTANNPLTLNRMFTVYHRTSHTKKGIFGCPSHN